MSSIWCSWNGLSWEPSCSKLSCGKSWRQKNIEMRKVRSFHLNKIANCYASTRKNWCMLKTENKFDKEKKIFIWDPVWAIFSTWFQVVIRPHTYLITVKVSRYRNNLKQYHSYVKTWNHMRDFCSSGWKL